MKSIIRITNHVHIPVLSVSLSLCAKFFRIVLFMVIALAFASCPHELSEFPDLPGNIAIIPYSDVEIYTRINAVYTTRYKEQVSFQWNRDGAPIFGATSDAYIPDTVGYYTVTVSAYRYRSITSEAVIVNYPANDGVINTVSLSDLDFGVDASIAGVFSVSTTGEWKQAIATINSNGNNKNYIINVIENIAIPGDDKATFTPTGIQISIRGNKSLYLAANGAMLTIAANQTVILRDLRLNGLANNNSPLVNVAGKLVMKDASIVTNNENTGNNGGGVFIDGGSFTMQDNATVSDNTAKDGGGVYLVRGTFAMEGSPVVSSNTAEEGSGVYTNDGLFTMQDQAAVSGNISSYLSGGVHVNNGSFTMKDRAEVSDNIGRCGVYIENGTISMQGYASVSGNTASGVRLGAGTFTMEGYASISNNTDGGVNIETGTFTMLGETSVSDNTFNGGVRVGNGTFTMQDSASVSGNTVFSGGGGGVNIQSGTFTMQDRATVSDNTAGYGGGVYLGSSAYVRSQDFKGGTFTMRDEAAVLNNTANSSSSDLVQNTEDNVWRIQSPGGGGVYIQGGTATMEGHASVSDNTALGQGGGVYISNGSFTMAGEAKVSMNIASGNLESLGGGVFVIGDSTFTMQERASVSDNSAEGGGGVFIQDGMFYMFGETEVSGNTVNTTSRSTGGGGVYVSTDSSFMLTDGAIVSYNIYNEHARYGRVDGGGGGVCVEGGTFIMQAQATIIKNTSNGFGGGVFVKSGTFKIQNTSAQAGIHANETDLNTPETGPQIYCNGYSATVTVGGISALPSTY